MAYIFTRGETVAVALRNIDSIPTQSITAKLKKMASAAPTGDPVATFTITPVSDLGEGLGSGWVLTLSAEQCLSLDPGIYGVDARIVLGSGAVEITDIEQITIKAGVTESVTQ